MRPILFFLFVLIITSCGDDFDIINTDIIVPDAEEISSYNIVGQVTDIFNEPIEDVSVTIVVDGNAISNTTTDNTGNYRFGFKEPFDERVFVAVEKELFSSAVQSISIGEQEEVDSINFIVNEIDSIQPVYYNVLTSDLISVKGKVTNTHNSEPILFVSITPVGSGSLPHHLGYTHKNGNYEVFVEKDLPFELGFFNLECTTNIFLYTKLFKNGLSQDIVVPDVPIDINFNVYRLEGQVLNCDGSLAENFVIENTEGRLLQHYSDTGDFSFIRYDCDESNELNFIIRNDEDGTKSETYKYSLQHGINDLGTIQTCIKDSSFLFLTIDEIDYTLNSHHVRYKNLNNYYQFRIEVHIPDQPVNFYLDILFRNNVLQFYSFFLYEEAIFFKEGDVFGLNNMFISDFGNSNIQFYVSPNKEFDSYSTGTFSGTFQDTESGLNHTIDGEFRLPIFRERS